MLYGCHLDLDKAEMQAACTTAQIDNLAIYKNIIDNLKYVGKFGNSNPHLIQDWLKVELDSTVESVSASLSGLSSEKCTISGALNIDFYMSRYGTKENPQHEVSRVIVSRSRLTWNYLQQDTATK